MLELLNHETKSLMFILCILRVTHLFTAEIVVAYDRNYLVVVHHHLVSHVKVDKQHNPNTLS